MIASTQLFDTSHPFFSDLSEASLNKLDQMKIWKMFRKGSTLITQGFPSPGFFYSPDGRFKLTLLGNHGSETVVSLTKPNNMMAFLGDESPFTVVVQQNCRVCLYPMDKLQELLQSDARFLSRVLEYSNLESQSMLVRLSKMMGKSARERIQMLLYELMTQHGQAEGEKIEVKPQLSREELSSMVGLAPETLIRILASFKDEGIIQQVGRKMFIQRPEMLSERYAMI